MRAQSWLFGVVALAALLVGCGDTAESPAVDDGLGSVPGPLRVDVLWVIDSTGSMRDTQAELARRFNEFAAELVDVGADFQIGVVSTDVADARQRGHLRDTMGCVEEQLQDPVIWGACRELELDRPFLASSDYVDALGVVDNARLGQDFHCIAAVGTCGDPNEAGIESALHALSPELLSTVNSGFLRDDAMLAVIFVTDEDDCSFGDAATAFSDADCYATDRRALMIDVQQAYAQLVALKGGDATRVLLAGIIGPDDGREVPTREEINRSSAQGGGVPISCAYERGDSGRQVAKYGRRYRDLIQLAAGRGVEQSICEADFGETLRRIGQAMRENLASNRR